jgi:soluble lytic murein transglycosylase-like protein
LIVECDFQEIKIYIPDVFISFANAFCVEIWKSTIENIRWGRIAMFLKISIAVFLLMSLISSEVYAECFSEAGLKYKIDPLLLRAIAQVESSMNSQAINVNRDGSQDIGIMQINSSHLERLAKSGITREKLLADTCLAVMVGAEILAGFVKKFGYTWRAVGAYNAGLGDGRDSLRKRYAIKVVSEYRRLKNNSR